MQANTPWASAATDLLVGCKCSNDLGPVIVENAARFPDRLRTRTHSNRDSMPATSIKTCKETGKLLLTATVKCAAM